MKQLPQISDAEYEVMDIIWKHAPIATNDIVEKLTAHTNWSPKTIQTMLFRLEKKGVIFHEKEGRMFVYAPRFGKEMYRQAAGNTFVSRFFDGAMNQMVVNYLQQSELTAEDIHELQAILDEKRRS